MKTLNRQSSLNSDYDVDASLRRDATELYTISRVLHLPAARCSFASVLMAHGFPRSLISFTQGAFLPPQRGDLCELQRIT